MRKQMESLIGEMLDGRILLDEAMTEFEKIYIQKALDRNSDHLTKTAASLGVHRNTLSKRLAGYNGKAAKQKKPVARAKKPLRTRSVPRRRKK